MLLNKDHCWSISINKDQFGSIKIYANQCGSMLIIVGSKVAWSALICIDLQWFTLIGIDLHRSALIGIDRHWSALVSVLLDRHWSALIANDRQWSAWVQLRWKDGSQNPMMSILLYMYFRGSGTFMTCIYKDNAQSWDTGILVLTFPSLQSSKIALSGLIFIIQTASPTNSNLPVYLD